MADARRADTPRRRQLRRRAGALALFGLLLPPALVATMRVAPPPPTPLMLLRLAQGEGLDQRWRPLRAISPALARAVVAAEDARFCEHHGFDWAALREAALRNAEGGRLRGGSTISQQTAKNVFLWPSRDYLRKGLEAGYTVLIEALWGKRRILEVYLNVVEWGPGVYGAEAAARRDFHEGADRLTPAQAARLAAVLPSPLRWSARRPGAGVRRRAGRIGANAAVVKADDLAACAGV